MLLKHLTAKRTITFLVIGLVFAICTAFALANCGPGFKSKADAVSFFKSHPAAAAALANEVSKRKAYNYHADQDIIAWLEQPSVKAFKAPQGYELTHNTYCPNGPGEYRDYPGLLNNMSGKLMLWYGNKAGRYFPILKAYCLNAVFGPPVAKKLPKKHPSKKCKCRKHKHHHHKPQCSTKSPGGGGGNCNTQVVTVTPKQECEASNHSTTGCQQTTTTVVISCGNYSSGNSGEVNQGGNCNNGGEEKCVGQNNCNETVEKPCECKEKEPPCECKKEQPKSPPEIAIETINDFETNEENVTCARTSAPTGDNLTVTFFSENGGQFANKGEATLRSGTTNEWCAPYTAPSEVPPGGCDIIKAVVVDNTTGLSGHDEKKAPIKPEKF